MDGVDPIAAQMAAEESAAPIPPAPLIQPGRGASGSWGPDGTESDVDPIAAEIRQEQESQDELQAKLFRWRAANSTTNAARAADVLRYAAATQKDPAFVDSNLDQVKREVDAEGVNWGEVVTRQPGVVQFMAERPEAQPLVHDDLKNAGIIEWSLKAPAYAFWDAVNEQRSIARQFTEATGLGSEENRQKIRELEAKHVNRDYGAQSFLSKGFVGAFRMAPMVVGDVLARAGGALLGGAAGTGTAGPVGGVGGAAVGQFAGSGLFNYYESLGPLYWQLSQLKDADGKPIDPTVARAFAHGGALISGGLGAGLLGKLGTSLPGVKELIAKAGGDVVQKALVNRTLTQSAKEFGKRYGEAYLSGAVFMASQSALNAAAAEGAKATSSGNFETDWGNVGTAAADGLKHGLEDMWLLAAIGPGRQLLKDVGVARQSAVNAARLEAMTESAAASKLLERSPEAFQEAVKKMAAEKGAAKSVIIPAEEWTRYWQEKKLDPGAIASSVMDDGGKAYSEALATKGDLAIPVEKYLAKLARTEHASGLAMDAKLYQEDLTPRQHAAEQERLRARLEEEGKVRGAELDQGRSQVFEVIRQQAEAAGIPKVEAEANAKIIADYARAMALRMGVNVQEAALLGGIGQLRILGPKGESAAKAAREAFQKYLHPEASRLLAERLETLSPIGRARDIYIDQVSGLRTRAAWEAAPRVPGKLVAVLTSPEVKAINDHPEAGHDFANEFLRVMGREVGAIDPEAARSGTNILFHVADEAELRAVIAKVKAALPDQRINLEGGIGRDLAEADAAMSRRLDDRRTAGVERLKAIATGDLGTAERLAAEGALPERGKAAEGLDIPGLRFTEGRAKENLSPDLIEQAGRLSKEEFFRKAYLHEQAPGLLSKAGWDNVPRKAYVASIDLKGIKKVNEKLGKAAGDAMLEAFARIARDYGGSSFDFARLGGDEFAAQASEPARLEAFLARIRDIAQNTTSEATLPTGERVIVDGPQFRYGIGKDTYGAADRDLNARKQREGVEASQLGRPAGGEPSSQRQDRGRDDLGRVGRGSLGRGASPQAFPGESGARGEGRAEVGAAVPAEPKQVVSHIEGVPVEFEQVRGGPRGSIAFRLDPTGKPVSFDIQILAGDRSTLAHETAHFLSWSLHEIAGSDLATPDIRADYGTMLKWAGYASAEERVALTRERAELARKQTRTDAENARLKELTAKEERISYGWEQFLAEGKAPSDSLARVFSRFKDWMLRIYKGVEGIQAQFREQYGEELALSDDVRAVFNRLLATSEALSQARADVGAEGPLPEATLRMTPEEQAEYRKALASAHLEAEKAVAERAAAIDAERVGEARDRIRADVSRELDSQPVYRAMRFLQRGELLDPEGQVLVPRDAELKDNAARLPDFLVDKDGQPLKLNRKAFVDEFGAEIARQMPPGVFHRSTKHGVGADELAPLLGFDSGRELAEAMGKAEPRDALIERRTQAALDEVYGPVLQKIQDAAMSAIHSDAAAHAALLELRGLAKDVNPEAARRVRSISLDTLKDTAARIIGDIPVGELNPQRYARAERATALKAAELWGRGEREASFEQRESRLLNQVLYREARDRQERLERAYEKLSTTSEAIRANLGKAAPAYRDVHDAIVEAVGIEAPSGDESRLGLDALLERAKLDAQDIDFDVEAIRRLLAKPVEWDSLSANEAQNVADAIANIRQAARSQLEVVLAGKRQTKDDWFAEFRSHIQQRPALPPEPMSKTEAGKSIKGKVKHLGRGADALFTDVAETYAHMLDVGDRNGPMHRLLVDGRLEARAKEAELSGRILKTIDKAWRNVPKDIRKLRDQRVDVGDLLPVPPGTEELLHPVYTRDNLWMLWLNWGNEGNRQRIRDGNGWSDANVIKALEKLTPAEIDWLQKIADSVESLYPELAAVYERRTGLKLDKVAASPFRVGDREFAGHYFPLKYDSRTSRPGEVQEAQVVADLFQPNYMRPTVRNSATKQRQDRVNAAVDLSWGVVPAHLSQVIHDIAYGDWVRQAGGIMLDERFKSLVTQHLGKERAKEFIPWLRDVANARADSAAGVQSDFLKEMGSFARNRLALAVMAHNIPNQIQGMVDPWLATSEGVKPHHVAAAYAKVVDPRSWGKRREFQLSQELTYRDGKLAENLRRTLQDAGPTGGGLARAIQETGFYLYEIQDRFNSRVIFKAAFDQGLSNGLDEAGAVRFADDVVRKRLSSHDIAERPPILRSKKGVAALLMFHSYANRNYNSLRRRADDVFVAFAGPEGGPKSKAQSVAWMAASLMAFGFAGAAGKYISGRGPEVGEDALKWLATSVAIEPFNTVAFLGSTVEAIVAGRKVSMRSAPELALIEETVNRFGDLADKATKGDADSEAAFSAAMLMLFLAGAPVGQIQRTGDYLMKVQKNEAQPRGALDVASGVIFGQGKKRRRNPLTDLQGVVSEER